jgi:restriction system protein
MNRVRTPLLPRYSEVQALLRILDGVPVQLFTGMFKSIWVQRGTPQRNVDWTDPDVWIAERLFGSEAELARHIWVASDRLANPRHIRGSHFFMRNHDLLSELGGAHRRTSRGDAFAVADEGIIREIDDIEGISQILCMLAARTRATRAELHPEWRGFCLAYSNYRADSAVSDTLWRRLVNLCDRDLVVHQLPEYVITDKGKTYAATLSPIPPADIVPPPPPPKVSFTDAAEQVLDLDARQEPMHYREITKRIRQLGLVETSGKTPEATLYSQITTEIDRATKRGDTPRFVNYGKGYFGLSRWMKHGLAFQIEQHNREVRSRLKARLHEMHPSEFEALIGRLLGGLGFVEVEVTGRSGDGGIDVRGTLVVGDVIRTHMAVQVKRWKNNIQAPVVQQVRGSLGTHDQGLIITTSDFSAGAREEAEKPDRTPVALMNGEQLVALLVEHTIGVKREGHDIIDLSDIGEDDA